MASGGLDGKVKIWDTQTILDFKSVDGVDPSKIDEYDRLLPPESLRRPMCSMTRHNGVVTSVKFSPNGRFLASGSDDKIVLIWEKDELAINRPKQFGETEAELEHWTVRKRLVAHENDIQDICWSPDGSLLVTVGLDRSIIIWSGTTFERIKRYDIHQSMVKGIVFDPANKFFATASDDRTVRIFRYSKKLHESVNDYEFQMEHVVFDPFKKSPLTSYFRRMSWSPDGQNIAVPNATNGPVPSVAIIKRGEWTTDVSLIGHEAPCEVCSHSPRLFVQDESQITKDKNFYTILATGGQDNTLAIWSTRQSRPLVVAKDIVSNAITDICWGHDGETLFLSCLDGSITCVSFDAKELGVVVSSEVVESQLHKFGIDRGSNVFPESIEQLTLEEKGLELDDSTNSKTTVPEAQILRTRSSTPPVQPSATQTPPPKPVLKPSSATKAPTSKAQTVTIKNGRKRVAPILVSTLSSTSRPSQELISKTIKRFKPNSKVSHSTYLIPRSGVITAVQGVKERGASENGEGNEGNQDNDNDDIGLDMANGTSSGNVSALTIKKHKNKIRRQIMEAKYPNQFRIISSLPESLFNHNSLIQHDMGEIMNSHDFENAVDLFSSSSTSADTNEEDLLFAVLVSGITHNVNPMYEKGIQDPIRSTIEVRNGPGWIEEDDEIDFDYSQKVDFQDPTAVIVTNYLGENHHKYVLYFPFKIQHALPIVMDGILMFYVLISFDGTVVFILADSGTYVCPNIELGSNVVCLKQCNEYLLAVSSSGLLYVWKLPRFPDERHLRSVVRGVSIAPILNHDVVIKPENSKANPVLSPHVKILEIDPATGSPYVILSKPNDVFQYSLELKCWTKVIDAWYFNGIQQLTLNSNNSTLNYLYHMSYNGFQDQNAKSQIGKYIFNESTKELEQVMKQRFNDFLQL